MTMYPDPGRCQGLFVGLTTLDLIYSVLEPPSSNQKLVASDYIMAAGGPATNAAIAFQYLSQHCPLQTPSPQSPRQLSSPQSYSRQNSSPQTMPPSPPEQRATVLSVVGSHPIGNLVRADIEQWGVAIADLNPTHPDPLPTSSIMVTEATGERAVVSLNAVKAMATSAQIPDEVNSRWDQIGVVLIDGHQMGVGEAIARRACQEEIPVVIDAGSWKPGFDRVLTYATYAICSANFYPPGCTTSADVHHFLQTLGIPHVAITHGSAPIAYWHNVSASSNASPKSIAVPTISPVDTLGAGDIFHGAFCYYLIEATRKLSLPATSTAPSSSESLSLTPVSHQQLDIPSILSTAAQIAAKSCTFFGTRQWMQGAG